MKMDRNKNADGTGKYALINLRKLDQVAGHTGTFQRWSPPVQEALDVLQRTGALESGAIGAPDEFFLIKLKDKNAQAALQAYAEAARVDDPEWAAEVAALAARSGPMHPLCKSPD